MILQPAVITQLLASALTAPFVAGGAWLALGVLRGWDSGSGSERQLALERRTYLISTLIAYAFGIQLLGLFLFVHTADALAGLLVGAMCAAGTLNANAWGYPALGLKIGTFILGGVWLVVNAVDNLAEDYPLVRAKYLYLLLFAPLVLAETAAQAAFLLSLRADVITSCCGTQFAEGKGTLASGLAALHVGPMRVAFCATMGVAVAGGVFFVTRRCGALAVAALSAAAFAVGRRVPRLVHRDVRLRAADAPLPVLHAPAGLRLPRLRPLPGASRRGGARDRGSQLQTGKDAGMQTMDQALLAAIQAREVDPEDAFTYAVDKRPFTRFVPDGTAILKADVTQGLAP